MAKRPDGATESGTRHGRWVHLPRVRWSGFVLPVATALALWLMVERLLGLGEIQLSLDQVTWVWAVAVLAVTQLTSFTEAVALSGAAPAPLALGPLTLLRFALSFTGLIGGTPATTATVVRFFRTRGVEPIVALSSGLMYSLGGFAVQIILTVLTLPLVWGDLQLNAAGPPGSGPEILQKVLWTVTAAGLLAGVALLVPRVRRLAVSRMIPRFADAWANVRELARDPDRVTRLLMGCVGSQLLMAAGLGLSLRAVGSDVPFPTLLMICTFTSLLGGLAPIPGGMGVMEACYISGLTLAGVPQDQAVGAVLIYRLLTAYLPPIWGWVAMVRLRRRGYL